MFGRMPRKGHGNNRTWNKAEGGRLEAGGKIQENLRLEPKVRILYPQSAMHHVGCVGALDLIGFKAQSLI
jgi:hypothetical protein